MQTAHPGLPEFEYIRPASIEEASRFLADHAGEARPFMGGTDTFVRMRDGFWKDKYLVDVKCLDGVNDIKFSPETGLTIGAAVSMNRMAASPEVTQYYPLLAEAAHTVASYQLRTRATVGGNITNASPAGDTTGSCLVMDGVLKVHGVDGYRDEPLNGFFKGPGRTNLKPGDIVLAIQFPVLPQGAVGHYIKLGRNAIGDLAIVGVTVFAFPDATAASGLRFRIAMASVGPTPMRAAKAEEILAGAPITDALIEEAAQATMDACTPIDDVRGTARYRKYMVRNLTRNGIQHVWGQIRQPEAA